MLNDKNTLILTNLGQVELFKNQENQEGNTVTVINHGYAGNPSLISKKLILINKVENWKTEAVMWLDNDFWLNNKKEIRKIINND